MMQATEAPPASGPREGFAAINEETLPEIIGQYGHPLLRYCHGILCDYEEAQDAVQLTFLKAYRRRGRYCPESNLKAWLYRIAYTTCIDLLRRKKLRDALPLSLPKEEAPQESGISEDLKAAMLSLKPADRALLWSRAVDNVPYDTLAQLYHVPASTLRKRYERAKTMLAAKLSKPEKEMEEKS